MSVYLAKISFFFVFDAKISNTLTNNLDAVVLCMENNKLKTVYANPNFIFIKNSNSTLFRLKQLDISAGKKDTNKLKVSNETLVKYCKSEQSLTFVIPWKSLQICGSLEGPQAASHTSTLIEKLLSILH